MPKLKIVILLLLLPLLMSGCIISIGGQKSSQQVTGGLFRSSNLGTSWEQVTTLYTIGGQQASFDAASVTVMAFDPLDNSAIYLGTQHDGIFYSYNYGDGWFQTLASQGTVNDIAVDGINNCTIYAAVHQTLYKTVDCSRSWKEVYFETENNKYLSSVALSKENGNLVYAGTSGGTLLVSRDGGNSWYAINRFDSGIKKVMIIDNQNKDIVYVATEKNGIFKSTDLGFEWEDLMELPVDQAEVDEDKIFAELVANKEADLERLLTNQERYDLEQAEKYKKLKDIRNSKSVLAISVDRSVPEGLIYSARNNLYHLTDGRLWQQIKLLNPPSSNESIYAVLVNPENTNEIFYATSQALYHSVDGGVTWSINKLPTNHSSRVLAFSLDNKFLYLGAYQINK